MVLAPRDTQVNLHVARNVAPAPRIQINLNTQNLPAIQMRVYRLDPVSWFTNPNQSKRPVVSGKPLREFPVTVARPGQRVLPAPNDNWYSRTINLPNMPSGVYLLDASVAGAKGQSWAVVNITQLAVVSKRSPKQALIWVTDFKSGAPVAGASANLYRRGVGLVGSAKTNKEGIAQIKLQPGEDTLVVQQGKDAAGVASVGFNPDGRLVSHVQTDRPVYRPGQKGFFKAILRRTHQHRYALDTNPAVTMTFRDPMDTVLDRKTLTPNNMGAVSGEFELPSEGALGPYTLVFDVGKDRVYHTVTAAAYRKPEFKVSMSTAQKRALAGEPISFNLRAETYFGAAVPNASVSYAIRRDSLSYWSDDSALWSSDDGNLYAPETYGSSDIVESDEAFTDEQGNLVITHKTDPKAPDATYSIEATVTDGSRRQVEGSTSMPVYAAAVRLGLRSSLVCVPLGRLVPIQVQITDLDGRPAKGTVKLQAWEDVWNEKKGEYVPVERASTTVVVPEAGRATAQLPAKVLGTMRITGQVKDSTGRIARSSMSTYVVGPEERSVRDDQGPTLTVRPEQRNVNVGGTVTAYGVSNRKPGVPSRKGGPASSMVLLTIEGGDLFAHRVVRAANVPIELKTIQEQAPNVTVTASQWVDGYLMSANAGVAVIDRSNALTVKVIPERTDLQPGERTRFKIETKNERGGPVSADIAFSLVDEAIFAIRPDDTADLYQRFWGPRNNLVTTYESAPQEVSGGAYQRVSTVAPIRQRFEDTAFWKAHVRTDNNGEATVVVDLPDNLTQWRATARAVTQDTRVGTARGGVRATRPVTMRLATPRQMVPGDRLDLIATVNNRTAQERLFTVRLGLEERALTVKGNSEGRVVFPIEAKSLGALELEAEVFDASKTAEFADALRVRIPVVPGGVAERVVESGTVNDERNVTLTLPADAISEATKTRIRMWAGLTPARDRLLDDILSGDRATTYAAIGQIRAAALRRSPQQYREAIAYLSRTSQPEGWGWWEGDRARPETTAAVLESLTAAQSAKYEVPERLMSRAQSAAIYQFNATNLWDHRALLAASILMAGHKEGPAKLEEVEKRGVNLSPFARLRLIQARLKLKQEGTNLDAVLKDLSTGATESWLPVGDGIGWSASELETNALLARLCAESGRLDVANAVANTLVGRLYRGWSQDRIRAAEALTAILAVQPESGMPVMPVVKVGDNVIDMKPDPLGQSFVGELPIQSGSATISLSSFKSLRYEIESTVYRPIRAENVRGIRVMRRYEVKNSAGAWVELDRELKPNEPVRCTVVAWGDSVPDALKIIQPIPAGFEFVEDEPMGTMARQEVRDGAVVHYVYAGGEPLSLRYYLRAESGGTLTILPATAEVLRRPGVRGQTAQSEVKVGG